ncbi:hypothetical protein CONLIGDRAFT_685943 [Coniochaeta ligniaria NRRL 30616]|uniref:Uncharacterized protein n=1 Tax=Coniochaeta ligniaria NRRL 30616 TaxID=1408157 RepID=A0A1J7J3C6_9PEZI|nr:hypothetical protein CONLIGDRAFT_685943 [Coniochaeta ligniaria NRRL 30616]
MASRSGISTNSTERNSTVVSALLILTVHVASNSGTRVFDAYHAAAKQQTPRQVQRSSTKKSNIYTQVLQYRKQGPKTRPIKGNNNPSNQILNTHYVSRSVRRYSVCSEGNAVPCPYRRSRYDAYSPTIDRASPKIDHNIYGYRRTWSLGKPTAPIHVSSQRTSQRPAIFVIRNRLGSTRKGYFSMTSTVCIQKFP